MRVLIALALLASTAHADKLGELVMDTHDEGHILYADRCSNGANADEPGRAKFVAALRADKQSRLAKTLAEAEAKYVTDKSWYEVTLGDWVQTYHLRDGCSDSANSYSAFVYVMAKHGNSNELWTRYVVTIDDDLAGERRTLKFRSAVPIAVRDR
jgi:hypothetical protein